MADINKDKILYAPELKPERHYESEAEFTRTTTPEVEQPEIPTPQEELVPDLEELYEMFDFLPDGVQFLKDTIDKIIKRQKIVNDNPVEPGDTPNIPQPNIPTTPIEPPSVNPPTPGYEEIIPPTVPSQPSTTDIPTTPSSSAEKPPSPTYIPENPYINDPIIKNLPDQFPGPTDIHINFLTPKTLVQIAKEDYVRDTIDLHQYYLQKLQIILQQYFNQMLTIMQQCGVGDIGDLTRPFDGETVVVSNTNLAHLRDYIVRSQISRDQKSRFFKKTHNVDNTLMHMRSWHAAEQQRERYYTEAYGDSDTYINGSSNALLRECRASYDKKYTQTLYDMYKYLNSSAILVGDILSMTVKEAQAKSKLLNEGVDIYVSKETIRQQEVAQQTAEYLAAAKKQETEAANSSAIDQNGKTILGNSSSSSSTSNTNTNNSTTNSNNASTSNNQQQNSSSNTSSDSNATTSIATQADYDNFAKLQKEHPEWFVGDTYVGNDADARKKAEEAQKQKEETATTSGNIVKDMLGTLKWKVPPEETLQNIILKQVPESSETPIDNTTTGKENQ